MYLFGYKFIQCMMRSQYRLLEMNGKQRNVTGSIPSIVQRMGQISCAHGP